MKYMVFVADGMADNPIESLNGKTPLMAAHTPVMDRLARESVIGLVKTIPDDFPPGSDVANMSVMGYDPRLYYTGRAPLEAVSMGVPLLENDLVLRCNFVYLSDDPAFADKIMLDYSAGEISTEEACVLISALKKELENDSFSFHSGISYRHALLWRGALGKGLKTVPPHDISDRKIAGHLPSGAAGGVLLSLMEKSFAILDSHPLNVARREKGLAPANAIWLWGQGGRPGFDSFKSLHGLSASVVCAVDLVRGLGLSAGMRAVTVPGATGAIKTDFFAKAHTAAEELASGQDFVFLHIESPDEAGHQGDAHTKVWSIEQIDRALAVILERTEGFSDFRLLFLPDHPTPVSLKTHTREPVPFLCWDKSHPKSGLASYHEAAAASSDLFFESGPKLLDAFLRSTI